MKRILLICGLLVVLILPGLAAKKPGQDRPRFARTWAADKNMELMWQGELPASRRSDPDKPMSPEARKMYEYILEHPETISLVPLIINGEDVKISYWAGYTLSAEQEEEVEKYIRYAYNGYEDKNDKTKPLGWFGNAVKFIQDQNREKEFADIMEILKRGMIIRFIESKYYPDDVKWEEHLYVEFIIEKDPDKAEAEVEKKCGEGNVACQFMGDQWVSQQVYAIRDRRSDLLHELGHTFGLGGAYEEEWKTSASETYRSKERTEKTAMSDKKDAQLTGDDADALINVIDKWRIIMLQDKHPDNWCNYVPARVRNGWDGLNRDRSGKSVDRYAMGRSMSLLKEEDKCHIKSVPRPRKERAVKNSDRVLDLSRERNSNPPRSNTAARRQPPSSADNDDY